MGVGGGLWPDLPKRSFSSLISSGFTLEYWYIYFQFLSGSGVAVSILNKLS